MDDTNWSIPLLEQEIVDGIERKWLDLPYASQSGTQALDVYLPRKTDSPPPLLIHFHGGAFRFGTRRDTWLRAMLRAVEEGYALASVSYRLSGEARFPALVYDAKAAVRYLRANAGRFGVDGSRFAAWGPSAGGYLAAMLGATNGMAAFENPEMGYAETSSDVQAVVNWCGPAGDFCRMDEQIRANGVGTADHDHPLSPESRLLGHAIQEVRELSRLAAPLTHVRADIPPFLIHHGRLDAVVPWQQSRDLAQTISAVAGADRVVLRIIEGKGHHGEPWFDEEWVTDEVFAFLEKVFDFNP